MDPPQQLLSCIGVAQISAPPLLGVPTGKRELRHPFRDRNAVVLRLTEEMDDDANLARALDSDIDEGDGENEPDRKSNQQRRQNAGLPPRKS